MVTVVIKHEWEQRNEAKAFETVSGIIKMAKESKLPQGFRLLSAYADSGSRTAFCIYEAPSKQAFQELVYKINPPTTYKVYEVSKLY